ncbi:MAG: hypothetical protein ABJN26_21500 [Stappiaceae bacterium]
MIKNSRSDLPAQPRTDGTPFVRSLKFAIVWSLVFATAIAFVIFFREQPFSARTFRILTITTLGAFSGGFAAYALAAFVARFRKQRSARFAAMTVFLAAGTYGMTALIYFFDYRIYFAQWHESPFTAEFFIQSLVTFLVSFYLFLLWGLHGMMPAVLLFLFAAGLWFVNSQDKLDRRD